MQFVAIRGAITVDENTEESIKNATVNLLKEIIKQNNLSVSDMLYINFSATKDITKAYPAKFVRTELGITDVPMMCYQEMDVDGSLEMCIRVLIVLNTINTNFSAKHVYMKDAQRLRPDLVN